MIEYTLAVLVCFPKIHQDLRSTTVYFAHDANLLGPFSIIFLIDTNGVNPDQSFAVMIPKAP
jgi:hypothetical protein